MAFDRQAFLKANAKAADRIHELFIESNAEADRGEEEKALGTRQQALQQARRLYEEPIKRLLEEERELLEQGEGEAHRARESAKILVWLLLRGHHGRLYISDEEVKRIEFLMRDERPEPENPTEEPDEKLTVGKIAKRLGISEHVVRQWTRRKREEHLAPVARAGNANLYSLRQAKRLLAHRES